MKLRYCYLYLFLSLLCAFQVKAQSSMMTEISYPLLDKLIQVAKENYPRMKAYQKQVNIAEANYNKAKKSWFDVLNVAYMRTDNIGSTNKGAYLLNGYQYGVNVNIGSLLQKPSQIKSAREELEIAWLQKDEYNKAIEKNVKEQYFIYIQKMTTLKLRMKAVQDAETFSKLILQKFERGEETYEQYNKVFQAYSKQSEEIVEAESEMLIAKANLEELVGVKLEELSYWQSSQVKK